MRILSIDYGKKRCGIAVTDPMQIIAHPLETVDNEVINKFLDNYLSQEEIEEIVIGYPTTDDNNETEITLEIKDFATKLQQKFSKIKITLWDEAYTSKNASKSMINAGFKKKDRQKKGNIDKIAATIILQDYLQNKQNPKNT